MIPCSTSPEGECYGQDYEQLPSIHPSIHPSHTLLLSPSWKTAPSAPVHNMAAAFFLDTVEQLWQHNLTSTKRCNRLCHLVDGAQ